MRKQGDERRTHWSVQIDEKCVCKENLTKLKIKHFNGYKEIVKTKKQINPLVIACFENVSWEQIRAQWNKPIAKRTPKSLKLLKTIPLI